MEDLNKIFTELSEKVITTLGPQGRYVAFEKTGRLTKDGATVAKYLPSIATTKEESFIAMMLEDLTRSANRNGDGTTSSVVLASSILKNGIKDDKSLGEAHAKLSAHIKSKSSTDISILDTVIDVAGHPTTNDIVKEAYRASKEVTVTHNPSHIKTTLRTVSGISIPTPLHMGFEHCFDMKDAFIVMYEGDIQYGSDLGTIIEQYLTVSGEGRGLVFMARSFSEAFMEYAQDIYTKNLGKTAILPVKLPWRGSKLKDYLIDIASIIGGQPVPADELMHASFSEVAGVSSVYADNYNTILTDLELSATAKSRHNKLLDDLEVEASKSKSSYRYEELLERTRFFETSYSEIMVGASTLAEASEVFTRTQDAVASAKAFLSSGAVPGGGQAFKGVDLGFYNYLTTAIENKLLENGTTISEGVYDATDVVINSLDTAVSLAKTVNRIKYVI